MLVDCLPKKSVMKEITSSQWCHPDTEIFSKRRKIYSFCVDGWDMIRRKGLSVDMHKSHALDTVPDDLMTKWSTQIGFQILSLNCSSIKYRFSAFWLRSKCSICSYQLNIWYETHVVSSILNWFLSGDRVQELAPALSRVGLALQCR